MSKRFRFLLVLVFIAIGGSFLYPTITWYFFTPAEQKELATGSREEIREYAKRRAARELEELRELAVRDPEEPVPAAYDHTRRRATENYRQAELELPETWTAPTVLRAFASQREALDSVESYYRDLLMGLKEHRDRTLQLGLDLSGGMRVVLRANMESLAERLGHQPSADEREEAVLQAMEILNNRIDRFGVTEPEIRRQGENQINIEIPGAADPDRVRSFLTGKGRLTFHIELPEESEKFMSYYSDNVGDVFNPDGTLKNPDIIPAGTIVRGFYKRDQYGIDQLVRYLVLNEEVGLNGEHIQDSQVGSNPITNQPVINFFLDREGGEIFYKLTSSNVGEPLAILLDDRVKAGARISGPIRDSVQMSGLTLEEATNLARVLRTGSLPVDLEIQNLQSVGASLGEDTIRRGLQAITLGFALVIVFMLVYYRSAGIIANLALILNLFFITAILSAFNLTLTLTSIAGVILTVGMAVDANVIIYERIKEEYRLGKSPQAAVAAGYQKAFWTVMDANITTFIAAIFLSQLASGPIQGFAVTLAVGIVTSMFTALFVSRLVFEFSLEVFRAQRLRIDWRTR